MIEFTYELRAILTYSRPYFNDGIATLCCFLWMFFVSVPAIGLFTERFCKTRVLLILYSLILAIGSALIIHTIFYKLGLGAVVANSSSNIKSIVLTLFCSFGIATILIIPLLGFLYPIDRTVAKRSGIGETGLSDIPQDIAKGNAEGSIRGKTDSIESIDRSDIENPFS